MDIPNHQFGANLIKIIQHISEAHFVSLDLEFTGIPSRGMPKQGRNSVEQIYGELREAAKRYQILQVGLTVVHEDKEKGGYFTRPYNFFINPVPFKERYLRLERVWSYQSGAVSFLLEHKFNFAKPFTEGVHYLSRDEEAQVRQNFSERDTEDACKKMLSDMEEKEEDQPLIDHIHRSIGLWLETSPEKREDYLNIPNMSEGPDKSIPESLSRYQMRLTHQTIRNHYPEFTHAGKAGFIQIRELNQENVAADKKRMQTYRERDLSYAIEFRWIVEALIGGDITGIPKQYFRMAMPNGDTTKNDDKEPAEYEDFVQSLQAKVSARKRVLVGHNLLIDLVYMYQTFIGDLPPTLAEFVAVIHDYFPTILDTKQLASLVPLLKSASFQSTALEALATAISEQQTPHIESAEGFERYTWISAFHEAGYDAFLTAQVAVKLSTRIAAGPEFQSVKVVTSPSPVMLKAASPQKDNVISPPKDKVVSPPKDTVVSPQKVTVVSPQKVTVVSPQKVTVVSPQKDKIVSAETDQDPALIRLAARLNSLSRGLEENTKGGSTNPNPQPLYTAESFKAGPHDLARMQKLLELNLANAVTLAQIKALKAPEGDTSYQELIKKLKIDDSDFMLSANYVPTSPGEVDEEGLANLNLGRAQSAGAQSVFSEGNDDGGVSLVGYEQAISGEGGQAAVESQSGIAKKAEMMPPWEQTQFWDVLGNKLCVGGSLEGVLDIEKVLTAKAEAEAKAEADAEADAEAGIKAELEGEASTENEIKEVQAV